MIDFIIEHFDDLLSVIGALVVIASFIVELTPTPKDDEWLGKIQKWIEKFSVVARKQLEEKKNEEKTETEEKK